jgi:hypothetical protein
MNSGIVEQLPAHVAPASDSGCGGGPELDDELELPDELALAVLADELELTLELELADELDPLSSPASTPVSALEVVASCVAPSPPASAERS